MKCASDATHEDRRQFLRTALSATGLALVGCATTRATPGGEEEMKEGEAEEAEVTPGEDLMQEHGVLERILLVYDEAIARIDQRAALEVTVVATAAGIVRRFIEDYHEKLEEEFVFPRLQAAGRETDLVAVLLRQHARGRELTDAIVRSARTGAERDLAPILRSFGWMYRPHAVREDTVLFPVFRDVVGRAAYRELGEEFEEREHELFGEHGFQAVVSEVADLERALGIHDLASFTPA
jgi:hemerythrin-like domain-containing protein